MENNSFTMLNEAGEEVKYDVLFTFDNEETNKSYIAYTDNTYDDDGNISVYASTYDPNSSEVILGKIETENDIHFRYSKSNVFRNLNDSINNVFLFLEKHYCFQLL